MKGFLIKDWYVSKKMVYTGAVVFLLIEFFVYLFRFSFIYGNPAKPGWLEEEEPDSTLMMIDIIFPVLTMLAALILMMLGLNTSVYADFKSKWGMFFYTLSYSEKQLASVKTFELLTLWGTGFIIGLVFNGAYYFFFGNKYALMGIFIGLVLGILAAAVNGVTLSMIYKYKSENTVQTKLLLYAILPLFALTYILLIYGLDYITDNFSSADKPMTTMMNKFHDVIFDNAVIIVLISVVTAVASVFLSYKRCLKLLERREHICGD